MINEHLIFPSSILLSIILLIVIITLVFHVASMIANEDFDSFEYVIVTTLMFIVVSITYIIVATAFHAMIHFNILSLDNLRQIQTLMIIAYIAMFFIPTMLILHHTFMYFKTRIMVVLSYCIVLALLLTYFTGV